MHADSYTILTDTNKFFITLYKRLVKSLLWFLRKRMIYENDQGDEINSMPLLKTGRDANSFIKLCL